MTLEGDLAYYAGLFDGEGSFSIQITIRKSAAGIESAGFTPKMTMTLKNGKHVLGGLVDLFGGSIYHYKDGMDRWNLSKKVQLEEAASTILPYLLIKKDICARFLEALSYFPKNRANHSIGERTWDKASCRAVAEIALTLNPATARKSKRDLSFLDEIESIYTTDHLVDAVIV